MNGEGYATWESYFEPGEKLLWQGAPVQGVFPGWGGLFLSAFGMPFFLIGWGLMIGSMFGLDINQDGLRGVGGRIFMFFFAVPFAMIGTGLAFGPWLAGPWAARRVRYALSNKRAYIAKQLFSRTMESYVIGHDDPLEIEQGRRADSVKFHIRTGRDSDGDKTTEKIGFDNIPDGEVVYHLIRKIQRGET